MKKKRQKSTAPASAAAVVPKIKSDAVVGQDLHESIRILFLGFITGIAVTVLYQNVTGRQAGGVAYSTAMPVESAALPVIVQTPSSPASSAHGSEPQVVTKLMPVPGLPVLPAPKMTPIRLKPSEPSGVQIKGIIPASKKQAERVAETVEQTVEPEAEPHDDGSGVHVEIRSKKKAPPDTLPAPAQQATAAPAPAPAPAIATSGSAKGDKPAPTDKAPQISLEPLHTKPLQLEPASGAPDQEMHTPKFTVIERQADGALIRVGNQVRFIAAGASLPDGTKLSAEK